MNTTDFAAGADRLGLAAQDVAELVALRQSGDCAGVHRRMADLVDARLAAVQAELGAALRSQAAVGGLGGDAGTGPLHRSVPLAKAGGRLQEAARILAAPPGTGPCTGSCPCTRAAAVTAGAYTFPTLAGITPPAAGVTPIVCTLDADGGDLPGRLEEWHAVLAQATAREQTDDGIAAMFDHDITRTAELARLLAAEYSCCSFASYHLTIDHHGVRVEIRTPPEGRDALAAMFGTVAAAG
jgi:MerR family transcriptional regulator, copper efflux regulator